jgi:Lrp/AsnC family transcriptional regulator, leucine-responsive regulatory protein
MKNISPQIIDLLRAGYCTPQIAQLARKLKEPSTTIHYNIKKLEQTGAIKGYKAVLDHRKIDAGFCAIILVNLSADEYGDPEKISKDLSRHKEIESIDICTGDWELVLKVHVKDQDAYYHFLRNVITRKGIIKTTSLVSFKPIKNEFLA